MFETPITAISWTQYTPGFCDGDPCTFQTGELQYSTEEMDSDDYPDYEEWGEAENIAEKLKPFDESWYGYR